MKRKHTHKKSLIQSNNNPVSVQISNYLRNHMVINEIYKILLVGITLNKDTNETYVASFCNFL